MDIIQQGLLLSAYGLGGVFFSLIVFYIVIRLLILLFPKKEEEGESK